MVTIGRLFLGDPRHDHETNPGPGVIVPPPTDQAVDVGLNHQFGAQVYVDVHGNNCQVYPGAYGFPTYYYPPEVLAKNSEAPRANALGFKNETLPAQEWLDSKSMNCITNAMLQAFCHWATGGTGQLATSEVIDYITETPALRPLTVSGCGAQYDNHGDLLGNFLNTSVFTGGRCVDAYSGFTNITFDAGDYLPVPGSFLNAHSYHYPDLSDSTSDKAWQIAAPGRMMNDIVRVSMNDEGWRDIAGNLTESVLETSSGVFTGKFSIRGRGIGFGSEHSDLNVTLMPNESILRVQRPEVKSALVTGRCMRFE
jgi:hypothetical protein